jgi:transcription-repair coupling factor (superfamily II helicase)
MKIVDYSDLITFLRREGYREVSEVLAQGSFAVFGDTVEVWPASSSSKRRYSFFGDTLERVDVYENETWTQDPSPSLLLPSNTIETTHGVVYPGDYVVHPYHGVGIFKGLIERPAFNEELEQYIELEYAGGDKLFVPVSREEGLMPYLGSRHPRLTRLNSKAWIATRERVKRDLIGIARELLRTYAKRHLNGRVAYALHKDWQLLLQQSADFDLTYDQKKALREIEADLASPHAPMDRLLCGDVGFGKTEVAVRAMAHVVASGKQVAFLAPTTVLVEQHYETLTQRFASLPVRIGKVSRVTRGGDALTKERIAEGTLDIVVGTHALIGESIHWKQLGLLVIDEEQKFGVTHKDAMKKLRPELDVLALSATPIPRTLSMSLSGIRGLSTLRHAPHGRLAVQTKVEPFAKESFRNAIARELERDGQVYVVHHRIGPLPAIAELISGWFPDIRVAVVHGQLPEQVLAERMGAFMRKEVSVLVASTIVEHGLDSPYANTLVVLRSEYFGLSDLYQLRGRVGRRSQQAYAHFFTGSIEHEPVRSADGELEDADRISVVAGKRLQALEDADTLGAGWSIAVRDLEIRGGGNILGHEQHGSMEAIGILLYGQLLQEEIGRQAKAAGIPLFAHFDTAE